jgi:hypothetical protein
VRPNRTRLLYWSDYSLVVVSREECDLVQSSLNPLVKGCEASFAMSAKTFKITRD